MLPTPVIEVKETRHKCVCVQCHLAILKGDLRLKFYSVGFFHAQCFVALVESIPDVERLWIKAAVKSVKERIQNA